MRSSNEPAVDWDTYWNREDAQNKWIQLFDNIQYLLLETTRMFSKHIKEINRQNNSFSLIELGCGGGNFLSYFQRKYSGVDLYGIDASKPGIELAKRRTRFGLPQSHLVHADIFQRPMKTKKFDIVFSFGLIEHFPSTDDIIRVHSDMLKKNGLMLIIIPNLIGSQKKVFSSQRWISVPTPLHGDEWIFGMKHISLDMLYRSAESCDITSLKITPVGGFFPLLLIEFLNIDERYPKLRLARFLHRYILFGFCLFLNIVTLFKMNSIWFSPYILVSGRKT